MSVDIKDPGKHLKLWSEMWLAHLKLIHQLSIKSFIEKIKLRQVPATVSHSKLMHLSTIFLGYTILQPYFHANYAANNAKMNNLPPKMSQFQNIDRWSIICQEAEVHFLNQCLKNYVFFWTQNLKSTCQTSERGDHFHYTIRLWWRHKMNKPVSYAHCSFQSEAWNFSLHGVFELVWITRRAWSYNITRKEKQNRRTQKYH